MKYTSLTIKRTKADFINEAGDIKFSKYLPDIKFTDSYAFVNKSLSSIVKLIGKDKTVDENKILFSNTYDYIKFAYPEIAEELFPFCTKKGVI